MEQFISLAGITHAEYRALLRGAGDPSRDEAWMQVQEWANHQASRFLALGAELRIQTERATKKRLARNVRDRTW